MLPSNGSNDVFSNNRAGDFTTLLLQPLDVGSDDSYKVALQEIQFIRAVPTVTSFEFKVVKSTGQNRKVVLKKVNFGNVKSFVREINDRLKALRLSRDIKFVYDEVTFRVNIELEEKASVEIPREWADVLGFNDTVFVAGTVGEKQADINNGLYNLHIY